MGLCLGRTPGYIVVGVELSLGAQRGHGDAAGPGTAPSRAHRGAAELPQKDNREWRSKSGFQPSLRTGFAS